MRAKKACNDWPSGTCFSGGQPEMSDSGGAARLAVIQQIESEELQSS